MSQPGSDPGWTIGGAGAAVRTITARTLCPGEGNGRLLRLDEPLSLWGGTDLHTGVITDVHHPQHGTAITGRVVVMAASRGSSSSSSVLAEQIRAGVGPAAMILTSRDAILALGAIAAAELYGVWMPIVLIDGAAAGRLLGSGPVAVHARAGHGGAHSTGVNNPGSGSATITFSGGPA